MSTSGPRPRPRSSSACSRATSSLAPRVPAPPGRHRPRVLGLGRASSPPAAGVKGENSGSQAERRRAVNHPKVPIGNWTFSNWPLYIDKTVLKSFDKKYGGHVKYVEDINDNFEFFAKVRQQLQAKQPINRDLVALTDYMAARWVRERLHRAVRPGERPEREEPRTRTCATLSWDPEAASTRCRGSPAARSSASTRPRSAGRSRRSRTSSTRRSRAG